MPQDKKKWKAEGNKEFGKANYTQAIAHYTKAIEFDDTNHVLFSNRSASYAGLKDFEKALSDAETCISLNPTWPKVDFDNAYYKGYFRKGFAFLELGRFGHAVEEFKKGLKHDPSNQDLKDKLKEAEEMYKKFKPRVNPDGTPMSPCASAKEDGNDFFKKSDYDAAIKAYTRALNLATNEETELKAALYSNRAACYSQSHNYNEVIKDCTECLKLSPGNLKALIRRGLAYEAVERWQAALDDLREVLLKDSSVTVAQQAVNRIRNSMRSNNIPEKK